MLKSERIFQWILHGETKPSRSWSTPITKMKSDSSLEGSGANVVDFSKNMIQMLMMQNERDADNSMQDRAARELE